jgi:hypothetical protein
MPDDSESKLLPTRPQKRNDNQIQSPDELKKNMYVRRYWAVNGQNAIIYIVDGPTQNDDGTYSVIYRFRGSKAITSAGLADWGVTAYPDGKWSRNWVEQVTDPNMMTD